jgi:hypothetical protein
MEKRQPSKEPQAHLTRGAMKMFHDMPPKTKVKGQEFILQVIQVRVLNLDQDSKKGGQQVKAQ